MADRTFEMDLERMYAEAPAFTDAAAFARSVTARLDRAWTLRRFLIGGLGLAGGSVVGVQILGSGALAHLGEIQTRSDSFVSSRLVDLPAVRGVVGLLGPGGSLDGQVLLMSAALAVVAFGLFVSRSIREI